MYRAREKAAYLLQQQDIYVKLLEVLKYDPAVDLGVLVACLKFKDIA